MYRHPCMHGITSFNQILDQLWLATETGTLQVTKNMHRSYTKRDVDVWLYI